MAIDTDGARRIRRCHLQLSCTFQRYNLAIPLRAVDNYQADETVLKKTWLPPAALIAFPVKIATVILIDILS